MAQLGSLAYVQRQRKNYRLAPPGTAPRGGQKELEPCAKAQPQQDTGGIASQV
jgi:hypothetical protein